LSPALGDRSLFPQLRGVYLNHGAISPLSVPVRQAMRDCMEDYGEKGLGALGRWMAQREELREDLGRLLGVPSSRVVLTPSTSRGLMDLALCLPWKEGQTVVTFEGEFPANVIPWRQSARHFGLCWKQSAQSLEALEDLLREGVRLVACSAVQFSSGYRMPIEEMGALCHRYGAELAVDGIQAVGAVPLDLANVDYLAGGSHKWLMGPEGCGYLYVAEGRKLVPRVAGWLSVPSPVDFLIEGGGLLRYDKPIRDEPGMLEMGSINAVGFAGLGAAVKIPLELGVERIYNHVQSILDPLEEGLVERGCASLRHQSCILAVTTPGSELETARILNEGGIAVTAPNGVLRMAPHWSNSVDQVAEVLEKVPF
jgi:cysteine desulfurase / selenocysteine lyase